MSSPRRLVVLASGGGSNLQAIIDAIGGGQLAAEISAVVTNVADAGALARADAAHIAAVTLAPRKGEQRADYDTRLADVVAEYRPDWIVLAGWMRLLSMNFLGRFPGRVVNLHPALPGELPGTLAIERAYQQARTGARSHTGVMVHLVPDEGVDNGPVLATAVVPIHPADTLASLEQRVHETEHQLLVDTLENLISHDLVEARHDR